MHVDVAGVMDRPDANAGTGEQGSQPAAPAGAKYQLRRVLGPREGQQGLGHMVADHLVVAAAERLD
jgi:hypothetical protein